MASYVKATLFIFSLYRLSSAQDSTTTCDIPWVEPLANTSVTCHFPINVNQKNSIFGVSFESNDSEKKIQVHILDCGWFSGKAKCSTNRPGYKYNDIIRVSNTFSLEIPQASSDHIGRYTCHLVNIRPENFKPCEFRVKVVGKTMCLISSMESNTRTSLTCYYPEDLNKTRMNFTVYHYSRTGLTEVIMACEWKGDNLTCNTTYGYEFDSRVSDYLTLKIPMALERQEGAYSCHISDNGFLHYDNCTVTPEKNDAVTSTCHISRVEEAKPTALTCKFSVDVNMTKRNFTVVRLSDADRKAAVIANCTWLRDNLTCTTAFGYQFNNTVTDLVIISVPQASHNHSGTYACNVTGTVSSGFEPCEFLIMPDKSSLSGFITAAIVIVIVMCISLSLIIVIFALKKKASHINTRPFEEVEVASERTPMIPYQDGETDQNPCGNLSDQDMVMIQEETVDTNQKPSQEQDVLGGHLPIQSDGHEEEINQTSLQSGLRDKDTQPLSNGDITGNDKTQDVLGGHSPIQSDGHEEEMNQTSPQSGTRDKDTQPLSNGDHKRPLKSGARGDRMSVMSQQKKKGSRKKDVATDDNQAAEIADENTWVKMEIDTETTSYNHRQSGCMTLAASNQDDKSEVQCPQDRIFKILIIGASGSGKSTAGNILLGKDHFQVSKANPFIAESVAAMIGESDREDRHLLVLDTPDICSSNVNNEDKARSELESWLNMCPDPHLILFTIRYSPVDLNDAVRRFRKFRSLCDEDFIRQRLVVLFTFGDKEAPSEEELQKKSHAGLQEILDYAGHRYVIFDPTLEVSEQQKHVDQVLCYLDELIFKRQEKDEHEQSLKLLIIGKTGNGKSTLGNSVLNKIVFPVTTGLSSSCTKEESRSGYRQGIYIIVIETPDVSNLTVEGKAAEDEIKKWSEFDPDLILLAIRCDVRYTREEHQIYKQIKRVLGEQFVCPRLAVAFTFGDRLNTNIKDELKSVTPELQDVLTDARHQYVVFSIDDQEEHREKHCCAIFQFASKKGKPKKGAKNLPSETTQEVFQVDCHHITENNTSQDSKREIPLFPDEPRHNINVLIVGKTGNGKSTVGNSLLNHSAFCVTSSFASTTTQPETQSVGRYGVNITVTDTPDLSNMSVDDNDVDRVIHSWRTFQPDVILLTIRCDVRYTPEEFQIYKQIKKGLRDDYLCPKLSVAFTFGERLDRDIMEELKDVCTELQQVLKDADDRYLVFREEDDEETKRKHIIHLMTFVPNLEIEGEIKKILLLGPPKSGKSSGGDAIVGRPVLQAGTETVRTVSYITYVDDTWCQVFDTPGISRPVEEQLRSLLEVTRPGPHAIFYFVRESIATTEDLELFRRFQDFIEENLRQHVKLVAIMDMERVPSVPKRVKDMEYISCKMSKEAKGGQTVWLIDSLTLEEKKKICAQHIKEVLKST